MQNTFSDYTCQSANLKCFLWQKLLSSHIDQILYYKSNDSQINAILNKSQKHNKGILVVYLYNHVIIKKRPYKLIHGLARKEALILQYRNRNFQENGYPILFISQQFDCSILSNLLPNGNNTIHIMPVITNTSRFCFTVIVSSSIS